MYGKRNDWKNQIQVNNVVANNYILLYHVINYLYRLCQRTINDTMKVRMKSQFKLQGTNEINLEA